MQTALITGAARRIGAEIAKTLHDAGMNVILHYHQSQKEAQQLCAALNEMRPHSAAILSADLGLISELPSVIEQAVKMWGRLDCLINNASQFYQTPMGKATEKMWNDLLATNLQAPFFLAQAAALHLAKQQGSIINITDIHATRPMRDYSVYCIVKAGLVMLTKVLAKELAPAIRVNAIAPGAIVWPEGENTLSVEKQQVILNQTALKRHGNPSNIAKAVLFLIRDAEYMTGQELVIDGGRGL